MNQKEQDLVAKCFCIAIDAHKGQFREDGKTPYLEHPKSVGEKFQGEATLMCIAFLHDVLEDSDMTAKELLVQGVPEPIVDAVIAMTKDPKENYLEYLLRVKTNPMARIVKIQDIRHNMKTVYGARKDKYLLALYILGEEK